MDDTVGILWHLLRSALHVAPHGSQPQHPPDADGWLRLVELARQNRVSALCSHAAGLLPEGLRPPRTLWLQWLAMQSMVEQKARHKNSVAHELTAIMKQQGIDTLVLKGPRLASCYPHPELREYDDVDVYHFGRHRDADRVAEEVLGLAVNTDDPHHSVYTYRGVTVENHYTFAHNSHAPSNARLEQRLHELAPSATFDALFLLRHTASHFAASHATLKSVCDWAMWVRTYRVSVDWAEVRRQVQRCGMAPFAASLQRIASEELNMEPVAALDSPVDKALVERMHRDLAYGEFARPNHRREGLSRMVWKWRRYHANRWKRRMVYRDAESIMLLRGIGSHLLYPRHIGHKH
ncbi:MAG: hypothetical protein AUK63_922 [bacterium P3]|nr:MAG: hypothetical protein AUK64_1079 [bacterium P201]KWW30476.1 MAG: hypothetical protein AUK63_922 [bacterium P3]KWW41363.1 MAG: hypothetical protein F083_1110 [bacterium F083]